MLWDRNIGRTRFWVSMPSSNVSVTYVCARASAAQPNAKTSARVTIIDGVHQRRLSRASPGDMAKMFSSKSLSVTPRTLWPTQRGEMGVGRNLIVRSDRDKGASTDTYAISANQN